MSMISLSRWKTISGLSRLSLIQGFRSTLVSGQHDLTMVLRIVTIWRLFQEENEMIELIKEFGMAILWLFLGYLIGEPAARKDKKDDQ